MATSDQVQQLYITYFGRPADPSGLAYWTADEETPLSVIAEGFATTPEFTADITGRTLEQIVNSFYVDLFGRNADPEGLAFWVNQIQIGNTTIEQAGVNIGDAALTADARGNVDNVALVSKIAASNQWTTTVAATTEATLAYTGSEGVNAGVNFLLPVLTTATIPTEAATEAQVDTLVQENGSGAGNTLELSIFQDVASDTGTVRLDRNGSIQETSDFRFTAGNQTVNGTAATYSGTLGSDSLVDGFTTDQDVLNITGLTTAGGVNGFVGGIAATVTNIENINLAFSGATNSASNVTGFTGVQNVTFSGSVANGNGLNLTMANSGATSFTSSLTGNNLSIFTLTTGNAAEAITTSDIADNITAANGNDTIISAGGNDTINAGAGNDSIESGDGGDIITLGAGADTVDAGAGANLITDAGNGLDVINHSAGTLAVSVTGSSTVEINSSAAGVTSTSTVSSDVDASDSTAAVTLTGSAAADTLVGGTGNDTINGGLGADVLTGNAGVDTFVYNQAAFTTADADNITDFTVGVGGDVFNVNGAVAGGIAANLTAAVVNIAGSADNSFIVDAANTGYATFALAEAAVEAANAATLDYVLIFRNTTSGNIEAWADADSSAALGGVQLVSDFDAANLGTFLTGFTNANVSVA